uniref:Protein kinase domain-containing protein n=1 Tax=Alexandrium monilatum TaxID=311494 RepID=A0A7S4PU14_9DINO
MRRRTSEWELRGGRCQVRPSSCGPRRNACAGQLQLRPLRRSPRKSAPESCEAPPAVGDTPARTRPGDHGAAAGVPPGAKPRRHSAIITRPGSPPPPVKQAWRLLPDPASARDDARRDQLAESGRAVDEPALTQPRVSTRTACGPAATQPPCTAGTSPPAPSGGSARPERCSSGVGGVLAASPVQLTRRQAQMNSAMRDRKPSVVPRARSAEPCRQADAAGTDAKTEQVVRVRRERAATAGDAPLQPSPASPSGHRVAPFRAMPSGVFGGRYLVGKYLGRGASATVWEAVHGDSSLRVAVKVFDQGSRDRRQAHREMKVLSRLQHSAVLGVFEVVESSLCANLVCEFVEGESLRAFAHRQPSHRLQEDVARRFYRQVVEGVSYCHERLVVHRDIKLENILLDHDRERIKIIDFGFAAQVASKDTKLRAFCGTPSYMAPEIVKGEGYSGFCTDVWALGVVVFALLVGSLPFAGRTEMQLYAKIRRGLFTCPDVLGDLPRRLIKGALRVDVSNRPSVAAILQHSWVTGAGGGSADQGSSESKFGKADHVEHHGRPAGGRPMANEEASSRLAPWGSTVPGMVLGGC